MRGINRVFKINIKVVHTIFYFIQKETLLASLFLFFLSTAAIFKMATLNRVAEQFASIGFIMLLTLIFLRIFKSSKKIDDPTISNHKKL